MGRPLDKKTRRREVSNYYVITTKRDLNTIKTMKINEEKEFGIYKVERQGTKQCRKLYSDHSAMMLNIDFISKMEATDLNY